MIIDDNYLLTNWERFITETQAPHDDCLKALDKLKTGVPIEKILKSWYSRPELLEVKEHAKEDFVEVFTMSDCINDMRTDLKKGKEKGSSTYIPEMDNYWTWRLSEFNIWTGYSNEGKSQFLRFLCLLKALMDEWPSAFYAPEDYPAKEFFDEFIHTASGYSTDLDASNFISDELYELMYEKLKGYFHYVYLRPPKNTLIAVLQSFIPLIKEHGVKTCVIDPLIKVTRPKEYINADDKFAIYVTTMCTDFARQFNVSLHLVMHQLTPNLQENGLYPKPSMYRIKGGGTWADGTDNINSIWRPSYGRDKIDDEVMFTSQKIKKQKLVGIPGDMKLRFNRKTNRYVNWETKRDLFDFDKKLDVPRIKLLFD